MVCRIKRSSYYEGSHGANLQGRRWNYERLVSIGWERGSMRLLCSGLWKPGCDNRHYVDYKRRFAENRTGAHEAHGKPHSYYRSDWAGVCGTATLSSSF